MTIFYCMTALKTSHPRDSESAANNNKYCPASGWPNILHGALSSLKAEVLKGEDALLCSPGLPQDPILSHLESNPYHYTLSLRDPIQSD
jgi:hypothetical protein